MTARICICDTPIQDRYLCPGCTRRLTGYLTQIRDLNGDLHVALTRMVRMSDRGANSRSTAEPLVYGQQAAEQIRLIRTTLVSWVRLIADTGGLPLPEQVTIAALTGWLVSQLPAIVAHRDDATVLYDEVQHLRNTTQRVVDQPINRTCTQVGPCPEDTPDGNPCPGLTWAVIPRDRDQRPRIECRTCGTIWHAEQWATVGRRILARQGLTPSASPAAIRRLARLIG